MQRVGNVECVMVGSTICDQQWDHLHHLRPQDLCGQKTGYLSSCPGLFLLSGEPYWDGDTQLNIEVVLHLLFKGVKRWREGGGMPCCGVGNKVRMHTHPWKPASHCSETVLLVTGKARIPGGIMNTELWEETANTVSGGVWHLEVPTTSSIYTANTTDSWIMGFGVVAVVTWLMLLESPGQQGTWKELHHLGAVQMEQSQTWVWEKMSREQMDTCCGD